MAGLRAVLLRIPRTAWLLVLVQLALLALLLASLGGLLTVGTHESKRANAEQQRVIIDRKTGVVSGLGAPVATEQPFDVAPSEEEAGDTPPAAPSTHAQDTQPPTGPDDAGKGDTAPPPKDQAAANASPMAGSSAPKENASPAPDDTQAEASSPPLQDKPSLELGAAVVRIAPVPRGPHSLAAAPAREISEQVGTLVLPKRAPDGAMAALIYGRPYDWAKEQTRYSVGVVVTGLGMDAALADAALKLPPVVSLSFSPYGAKSRTWAQYARNLGHEAWLDLPAQTASFPAADPGPLGLYRDLSASEVIKRLRTTMQACAGFVGVVLPPGQTLLPDAPVIMPALEELRARGLLVLAPDSDTPLAQMTHLAEAAEDISLGHVVIGGNSDAATIKAALARAESFAHSGTPALLVVQASPLSLSLLAEWLPGLRAQQVAPVPMSAAILGPRP